MAELIVSVANLTCNLTILVARSFTEKIYDLGNPVSVFLECVVNCEEFLTLCLNDLLSRC